MMLHHDGSQHAWRSGHHPLNLIITIDDATNEICSAFPVPEEDTASTFQALLDVFGRVGRRWFS